MISGQFWVGIDLEKKSRFWQLSALFNVDSCEWYDPEIIWNLQNNIGGCLISNGFVISWMNPEKLGKTVFWSWRALE